MRAQTSFLLERQRLLWLLRATGSTLLVYLIVTSVPFAWNDLSLNLPHPLLAAATLVLYATAMAVVEGARYWVEMRRCGVGDVSYLNWVVAFVRSRPWTYVVPVGVAGEAAMLVHGRQRGGNVRAMLHALFSVRFLGLLSWAGWLALIGFSNPALLLPGVLPDPLANGMIWLSATALGALAFIMFERWSRRPLPALSLLLSFGATVLLALTTHFTATVAGIVLEPLAILAFLAFLSIGLVLPISLGGLGLQEAILLVLGANAGVPVSGLFVFSALLHLQRIALAIAGALMASR